MSQPSKQSHTSQNKWIKDKLQWWITSCANNYDQLCCPNITVFCIRCQAQEDSVMRWTRQYGKLMLMSLECVIYVSRQYSSVREIGDHKQVWVWWGFNVEPIHTIACHCNPFQVLCKLLFITSYFTSVWHHEHLNWPKFNKSGKSYFELKTVRKIILWHDHPLLWFFNCAFMSVS